MRNYIKLCYLNATILQRNKQAPHNPFTLEYQFLGEDQDDCVERAMELCYYVTLDPSAIEWSYQGGDFVDVWLELNKQNVLRLIYPWQVVQTDSILTNFQTDQWTPGGTVHQISFHTDELFVTESPKATWSHGE